MSTTNTPPNDPSRPAASTDESLTARENKAPSSKRTKIAIGVGAGIVAAALVGGGITWAAIGANAGDDTTEAGVSADPDASIVVGLRLEPTSLDIRNVSGAALDQILIDNVYEGLVSRSADGSISPSLASEWDVADDGLTYTFTLEDGATFSNGDALTAEDVVWSIDDVIDNERADAAQLAKVADVAAEGDDSVVITLSERDPNLLWSLAGRPGLVVDADADYDAETAAIGSGPFLLDEWKQGDSITLVRNEDYWGEQSGVAEVVFQYFTDENAAVNAATAGDVDVLTGSGGDYREQLEAIDGASVAEGFASDKFTLAFNNAAAPLDTLEVRQAIRYAIDHEAIVEAIGGTGEILGGPIVESDPGYEDLSDLYPHDIEQAKALLAEAGYGDGLDLTLTIPSFYGTTVTDLLTSQLAEAGITLTVNAVEFGTWLTDVYTNKDYQLSIVDHAEARDFANWANPDYYFGYDDAEVQSLYAEASVAASEDEQATLLAEAARIVSEDAAADWLYNSTALVLVSDRVSGFPTDSTSSRLDVTTVTATS